MKKILLGFIVLLGLALGLGMIEVNEVQAEGQTPATVSYKFRNNLDGTPGAQTSLEVALGSLVSFDAATDIPGHDFLGFINHGKVVPSISNSLSIRVTENTDVTYYFKPTGSTAVIFMDANQDFVEVRYTNAQNKLEVIPGFASFSKPGLEALGWTDGNGLINLDTDYLTDTIVYIQYQSVIAGQLTLDVANGTGAGSYNFNDIVTVTATGTGTFNYWLKDGIIASLDQTYSFTMADNHELEAVYDSGFVADSSIFVTANLYEVDGKNIILGQFDLPEGQSLVEWGILTSDLAGGITFDSPEFTKHVSGKYNGATNEFVLIYNSGTFPNYRAYVTTIDEEDNVTTIYSYYQEMGVEETYVETFATSNATASYGNGSFIGVEGITWSYVASRDGNGDANKSGINLPALMLRRESDSSSITSSTISGGISFFEVKLYKGFTGGGNRQVELFINDISKGTSTPFDDFDEHVYRIENLNVEGDFIIEIKNFTSAQIIIDDITWGYSTPSILATEANTPNAITITGDTSVNMNETIQLSTDIQDVIWVSSNTDVLTVDENGLVTCVAEGTATVTAHSFYNHSVLDTITITGLGLATYDVTFNDDGVTSIVTVDGGSTVSEPAEPTRTGFEFDGWYANPELTTPYVFSNPVLGDISVYAKWNVIYDIIYNLNGGTNNLDNPSTYTVKTPTIVLEAPTKESNVFAGWYETDDFTGSEVIEITLGSTGDITLFAKWEDSSSVPVVIRQSDFGTTNGWGAYSLQENKNINHGLADPSHPGTSVWSVLGGNVNNTGWDFIRMGGKSASSESNPNVYLKTEFTFGQSVSSIVINIIALDSAAGTERIHLQVSSDNTDWSTVSTQDILTTGDLTFDSLNIAAGNYIRFVFERAATGSNVGTDVKTITFYSLPE